MPESILGPQTMKPRGFAAMTPERRTEVAKMGGASVSPNNRSFSVNRELAKEAGRKGGLAKADWRKAKS